MMIESLERRSMLSVSNLGGGVIVVNGSNAADTINVTGSGQSISVSGSAGTDSFTGVKVLLVYAQRGNDGIAGQDGNDTIHGGSGNDRLDGGRGVDLLYGDAGKDVVISIADGSKDTIHKDAADYIFGDKTDSIL